MIMTGTKYRKLRDNRSRNIQPPKGVSIQNLAHLQIVPNNPRSTRQKLNQSTFIIHHQHVRQPQPIHIKLGVTKTSIPRPEREKKNRKTKRVKRNTGIDDLTTLYSPPPPPAVTSTSHPCAKKIRAVLVALSFVMA